MSDPSGEETSALSLEDELTQAFGAETPTEEEGTTASAAQAPAMGTAGGEQNAEQKPLEAPKHWNESDKALFSKAPRDIQGRWISRETEQQRGLDAKFQEIAAFRRERERLDELLTPFSRDLELRGVDRMQFVQSLIGGHKYLMEKPREALLWLASQYGVDPKTLLESPEAAPHTAEIQQLRSEFQGFLGQQRQAEHQVNLHKVQSFAEAKDEKGQPAHPHFDEVSEDILALMKAGEKDLDRAYQKAVRMNDAVWEKEQARRTLAASQTSEAERKAKIDKAKRAAVGSDAQGVNGSAKPKSLREDLEAGFAHWQP